MPNLTHSQLKTLLDYDQETGVFVRLGSRIGMGVYKVGHLSRDGYRYIRVEHARYLEHRLAWFYVHGVWPVQIDHVNGNKSDNRIANLRIATRSQNMQNIDPPRHNSSGVKGVCFDKTNAKWLAYIQLNGKFVNLGRHDTLEEARLAREKAAEKFHGSFARHKPQAKTHVEVTGPTGTPEAEDMDTQRVGELQNLTLT